MTTAKQAVNEGTKATAVGSRLDRTVGRLVFDALHFTRADPAALAAFDPSTRYCTMNCGPHRDDPRTQAERKLLCGDCVEDWNR